MPAGNPAPVPDFPPFRPRLPWLGGDLQTLRGRLRPLPTTILAGWPGRRLALALPDGDRLLAMLHLPAGAAGAAGVASRPLVVLLHGLTGCEDSAYILVAARTWLAAGWPVLRLNLRGAGPSASHCHERYHAGCSDDLRAALAALSALEPDLVAVGLVATGYSLGGNILLKYLAGEGAAGPLLAAATVSAPVDLAATSDRMHRSRNRLYMRWLLTSVKRETRSLPVLSPAEARAIDAARTIYGFDDAFIAPRYGFAGVADYYARSSALPLLPALRTPVLMVHAPNDPWIPLPWGGAGAVAGNPRIAALLGANGGHVGFHGAGHPVPWHERCVIRFLARQTGHEIPRGL